ncbi:MAG: hypothetical protein JWQ93_1483 [Marmoricola sp.]|jgi:hypothetical protein|nr:hypothetical protein [Marmoricola sp.]
MFGSTMLLTVGHALDRAKDEGTVVRMHIGGDWITGRIMSSDGHGVAVLESNGDLCVVRQEAISCVRLPGKAHTGSPVPPQHSGVIEMAAG